LKQRPFSLTPRRGKRSGRNPRWRPGRSRGWPHTAPCRWSTGTRGSRRTRRSSPRRLGARNHAARGHRQTHVKGNTPLLSVQLTCGAQAPTQTPVCHRAQAFRSGFLWESRTVVAADGVGGVAVGLGLALLPGVEGLARQRVQLAVSMEHVCRSIKVTWRRTNIRPWTMLVCSCTHANTTSALFQGVFSVTHAKIVSVHHGSAANMASQSSYLGRAHSYAHGTRTVLF